MTNLAYYTGQDGGGPGTYYLQSQSMTYNVNGQLSSSGGIQYVYSATQNNGQIAQAIDTISGETISYQYDALKRLTSASATPTAGSSPAARTQTYQYDGFGNLTAKTLNGAVTPIAVNAATNRLTNASYDASGNMTSGLGATLGYDAANRMSDATTLAGGLAQFRYDASNKAVYRVQWNGASRTETFTFYGARGEKLGVYSMFRQKDGGTRFGAAATSIWFAGKLIVDLGEMVYQDRLGTNRAKGARFYPYGDEVTSTTNNRVKFGTYTRDAYTGLDYADQRYYASSYGRFTTHTSQEAARVLRPIRVAGTSTPR
jgi:YD repeat-containing protein